MTGERGDTVAPARDPRAEDRIVQLLRDRPGALAFNGLRRSLGLHPESLSRALRRLERYGLIERGESGYRLTPDPDGPEGPTDPVLSPPDPTWRAVAEVEVANGFDHHQVLGLLAGHWAGELRWVGVYDRPEAPLLVWSTAEGASQVLLGFHHGHLRVYVEPNSKGEISPELNGAARDLLVFALGKLRSVSLSRPPPTVTAFAMGVPAPRFGAN